MVTAALQIRDLGSQGDGVAEHEGGKVFVPLALPGETVTAEVTGERAKLVKVMAASPDRVDPRCSHYGECGGCALQHLADEAYLEFKRRHVVSALSFQRIDAAVDAVAPVPPRSRRRAVFAAHRTATGIEIGFHGRRSHHIVPIRDCPVLRPGLLEILPKLERLAAIAAPPRDALTITATETVTGCDISLTGVAKNFPADGRVKLSQLAGQLGFARVAVNGEVIVELTPPTLRAGAAHLVPSPGGFLQACEASEAAMRDIVKQAVGDARRIVDLFAGSGTFSLPLASTATVHAVESDEAALTALDRAARKAQGLKPVTTEKRDLFRRPLTKDELARFDAAVIDPPRAGAEAQSRELAESRVRRIAMVSCNATTFARDMRILLNGGYRVTRIAPIDQFLWSPHIEIVASLER